jgi:hypothetical protein
MMTDTADGRVTALTLPSAGRELDRLVVRYVFQLPVDLVEFLPSYSTFIDAAWRVVEKLVHLRPEMFAEGDESWVAIFDNDLPTRPDWFKHSARGNTAPLAICRAALIAVGYDASD